MDPSFAGATLWFHLDQPCLFFRLSACIYNNSILLHVFCRFPVFFPSHCCFLLVLHNTVSLQSSFTIVHLSSSPCRTQWVYNIWSLFPLNLFVVVILQFCATGTIKPTNKHAYCRLLINLVLLSYFLPSLALSCLLLYPLLSSLAIHLFFSFSLRDPVTEAPEFLFFRRPNVNLQFLKSSQQVIWLLWLKRYMAHI